MTYLLKSSEQYFDLTAYLCSWFIYSVSVPFLVRIIWGMLLKNRSYLSRFKMLQDYIYTTYQLYHLFLQWGCFPWKVSNQTYSIPGNSVSPSDSHVHRTGSDTKGPQVQVFLSERGQILHHVHKDPEDMKFTHII